jgi:hypothetical protein
MGKILGGFNGSTMAVATGWGQAHSLPGRQLRYLSQVAWESINRYQWTTSDEKSCG